ncbi:MAG: carbohydrate ABC transporter permease [Finegoldia sp.]|nr:carbohydrate ABC transporter permease [Finegoldia sp.]
MKNKKSLIKTILLAIILFFMVSPIFILINSSLKTYNEILKWPPSWFNSFHFENYKEVIFGDNSIVRPFINSLQISIITTFICIFIGSISAYAVTRFNFIGKKVFLFVILLTQMFSQVILVNPMYMIFSKLNLLDTKLSLIISVSAICMPMTIWLLYSYFSNIPIDYEEASWMDGSSRLQGIKNIVLPLAGPGLITSGLFAFIASWGDLIFSQTFIMSSDLMTISVALTNFRDLYKTNYQTQMAASVLATIPPFIVFLIVQKHLINSRLSQEVKG